MKEDVSTVVVIDAGPLAQLLAATPRSRPVFAATSRGSVVIAYSRRLYAEVGRRLAAAGLDGEDVEAKLAALERFGREVRPTDEVQVFPDEKRDEGVRLAVAAGAAVYLTADEELAALGQWHGTRIVADVEQVRQELLADEETAVAWRAASEQEATMVAEALAAEGIEAQVASQQVPWYNGVLIMGQGYWGHVVVFEKDLARARRIIEELEL